MVLSGRIQTQKYAAQVFGDEFEPGVSKFSENISMNDLRELSFHSSLSVFRKYVIDNFLNALNFHQLQNKRKRISISNIFITKL